MAIRIMSSFCVRSLLLYLDYVSNEGDIANVTNTNNYNWIVSTSQNTSNGNVFSLSIYDPGTHDSFMSHYFNLTEASEAPSPTTLSSSVLGATTTAAVTMTPEMVIPATLSSAMAATNSLPPAVASSDPVSLSSTNGSGGSHHNYTGDSGNGDNNGLDSITKIGIGVGVGVGIPLFIALGITVGWMLRSTYKKRKASGHPYRWRLPWMSVEKNKANQKIPISPPMPLSVQELAGPQFIYELPTGVTPRSTIVPVLIPADRSSRATHKSHKSTSQHQSALQHQSTSSYYFDPAVIRGSITSYKF